MPNLSLVLGQKYAGIAIREADGEKQSVPFAMTVVEDVVMCGGARYYGLQLVPEDRDKFDAFEAEYIEYCINEGGDFAASNADSIDPEHPAPVFSFRLDPVSVVPQAGKPEHRSKSKGMTP